jgi:hypothetical protein
VVPNLLSTFQVTLQPGVWNGFSFGPSSGKAYLVKAAPTSLPNPSDNGAYIVSTVQPEFDGTSWNDVVRVELMAATVPVDAAISVYTLSPIPPPRHHEHD